MNPLLNVNPARNLKNVIGLALVVLGAVMLPAQETPPPAISGFSPASGPVGARVTITGENLGETTGVFFFDGVAAEFGADFTGTQLVATVPTNAMTGPITVVTPGGTNSTAGPFSVTAPGPVIIDFSPRSGPVTTQVAIYGENLADAISVEFNGVLAGFTSGVAGTNIFASVPRTATTGPITVKTQAGTHITAEVFTVTASPPPVIDDFTPTNGPVGTQVTLMGSDLRFVSEVLFNGVPAQFGPGFFGTLVTVVPPEASTGPITVVSSGGTNTSAAMFTVTTSPPPVISDFSPQRGRPGDSVQLTGEHLNTVITVRFADTATTNFTLFGSALFVTVPEGAMTGPITVEGAGGSDTTTNAFTVLDPLAPRVTGFSPPGGPEGLTVNIAGENFTNVVEVIFAETLAEFTLVSPTQIDALVPTGALSGPISVTTSFGSDTTGTNFFVLPRILEFGPPEGEVGTQVLVTGVNFTAVSEVRLGGALAPFTVLSGSEVEATVPEAGATGLIEITTPGGTASSSNVFRVIPRVDGFTPRGGLPGTVVRIFGTGFTGATNVMMGDFSLEFTVVSPTEIQATVAPEAVTEPITVVTPGGLAHSADRFFVGVVTDLAVAFSGVPDQLKASDRLAYTVAVTNQGPAGATNIALTIELPEEADQIFALSNRGSCSQSNQFIVCIVPALAAGENLAVKINGIVLEGASSLTNVAAVQSDVFELEPEDNSALAVIPIEVPVVDAALSLRRLDSATLELAWPAEAVDWILEVTGQLGAAASWSPATNAVTVAEGSAKAVETIGPDAKFFRLRRP